MLECRRAWEKAREATEAAVMGEGLEAAVKKLEAEDSEAETKDQTDC